MRRSRPLSLGYTVRIDSDTAVWGYTVELAHNLSGGGGNNPAGCQSEDPRIGTSRFTALRDDAGWLRNNNPNATNKPPSDHLAGAGLGLRYNQGLWAFSAEWACIVTGSVLANAANPTLPRAGRNRLHVNLSAQF